MLTAAGRLLFHGFLGGVSTSVVLYALYEHQLKAAVHVEYQEQAGKAAGKHRYFPFGVPEDVRYTLHYTGHSVHYDGARKQPLWVAETITKESIKGKADRKRSEFRSDESIHKIFSADNSDYQKSGWSRGHMAAAGNFKYSQEAMDDTFLLTNIVPQDYDNNSGFWNRLEMYCRDLTKQFDEVHIISGPLYTVNVETKDRKFVRYEVIGKNMVPVPTHLFKVVTAFNDRASQVYIAAFVVPNTLIPKEQDDLTKYKVSLAELTQLSGIRFHPQLERAMTSASDLCSLSNTACRLKEWKNIEMSSSNRKTQTA